ncbi:MAG TPA: single-stranded DNA-binding protein [Chloroflexota bacterium]|jgi:single-strand DNA-binding protein
MVAKLTLVGNLGVDPEVRYTADGKPVLSCRVASNYRKRVQETREWVDATNWYRVSLFGRLAERMSEQISAGRLVKGSRVVVFGRLEASAYLDRNNQAQPSLDIIADDLILIDSRPRGEGDYGPGDYEAATPAARPAQPPRTSQHMDEPADLEDLPF